MSLPSLRFLYVGYNYLKFEGVKALAAVSWPVLVLLDLNKN
jgi:hypothetical protein